jgi:hypothetical protein
MEQQMGTYPIYHKFQTWSILRNVFVVVEGLEIKSYLLMQAKKIFCKISSRSMEI